MDNILIIMLGILILFFLYSKQNNITNRYVLNMLGGEKNDNINNLNNYAEIDNYDHLHMRSNFVKPNNKMHHLFKHISQKNKIELSSSGIERMYTKLTIDEQLLYFIKYLINNIIKKTKKIKNGVDYYLKDIVELYQQVDTNGNQRYIVNCFIYDIKNFYEIRILIDFVIINNDIYLNYIGEDIASNDNIINRYDYTMTNTGYLENRNQIKNNMKQIVDGYYRKYYNIIGYDAPTLDYSHYISKLDTVYKFNIGDLTKYYVPPEIPQLYSQEFGENHGNDWDESGVKIDTGNNYLANNNSAYSQPNVPLDSPGSNPHTRSYEGEYDYLQKVSFNNGGNVVSSSWYY